MKIKNCIYLLIHPLKKKEEEERNIILMGYSFHFFIYFTNFFLARMGEKNLF